MKYNTRRILFFAGYLFLFASCAASFSGTFPYELAPSNSLLPKPPGVTFLSSKGLKLIDTRGREVTELSGISWDTDEKILYAINDEGRLYHLRLTLKGTDIQQVKVIAEYRLRDEEGRKLKKKWRDSEGLSSRYHNNRKSGDTELLVSFEGKPRVVRYTPQGRYLGEIRLPRKLWKKKTYKSKNKALESVTVHPLEGVLTAAEFPINKKPATVQTLFSSSGKEWDFPATSARNSAITGLEVLPDGKVLILERAWAGIQHPIVITLSVLDLHQKPKAGGLWVRKELARLSSAEGWLLDNFEGLAHYRDKQYFMISDDGGHAYQTTVLVLFQVK